jgi:hypothetical protein
LAILTECNTITFHGITSEIHMTLTVRLPEKVEQALTKYCATRNLTKSEAVKLALEEMLRAPEADRSKSRHPFIGGDTGDGSDVSGNIKAALRARFRQRGRY